MAVATRRFAASGFDGTSLRDIAEEVGVRKPSLLYHFSSKEQLRLAVLEQLLDHWNDVLPRLLMASAGGELRFETLMDEMVSFFGDDPMRAKLMLRELLDRPDDLRALLESHVRPWVDAIAGYIRRGQERGEIHGSLDPEAYILQVINLVVSGVAAADSLQGGLLTASDAGEPAKRHYRELLRIAHTSFFAPDRERPGERDAPLDASLDAGRPKQLDA